ncbi:UNVERIFIED_CONTAM: hypothetical protein GTU68_043915 [Idotea baltica]|nr:hypothetical protein [Idotea baltica]
MAHIAEVMALPYRPKLILGGGSNMMFTVDFEGLVIQNGILGIEIVRENESEIIVKVGGGMFWHDLVEWAVSRDYGGLENLSLIPGTVGAAPIQNIGAYGVEFDSIFHELQAIDITTGSITNFDKEACEFGYRTSIFKGRHKGRFFITNVSLRLTKCNHQHVLSYGAIATSLTSKGIMDPTVRDVSDVVIDIRKSKLPDPAQLGNAGSFFKNPVVSIATYRALLKEYPNMPSYQVGEEERKIPAAWLIEKAGWKGFRDGDSGVYDKHALVLVNYGDATGSQMNLLALQIIESIFENFGIGLETEVNMIGAESS